MRFHRTHNRDGPLRRLTLINRWLIAGSVTLTGVLTDVAAHAFPSKAAADSPAKTRKSRSHHHSSHSSRRSSSTSSSNSPCILRAQALSPCQTPQRRLRNPPRNRSPRENRNPPTK